MLKHRSESGLALIEIIMFMMLFAIVFTVLAPHYRSHRARGHIEEILQHRTAITQVINQYYAKHRVLPKDTAESGLPQAGALDADRIAAITWENGVIAITPKDTGVSALDQAQLILAPQIKNDALVWQCSPSTAAISNYLPPTCQ